MFAALVSNTPIPITKPRCSQKPWLKINSVLMILYSNGNQYCVSHVQKLLTQRNDFVLLTGP